MTTEPDPEELSERAATARARLDALVSELDHRRHVVARTKRTLAENPAWVAGAALAVGGLVALFVALAARRRRQRTVGAHTRRLLRALTG
jgi:hypothetical protein